MNKKFFYISFLLLLMLFSSCKSKRNLVSSLPSLEVVPDSALRADTVGLPASLVGVLTFDQSDLRDIRRMSERSVRSSRSLAKLKIRKKEIVKRGTQITFTTVDVSSSYKGVKRVRMYDFTHRDVPEAFDSCRIAFISDLHYKSLLKEEGLADLVRLLSSLHADVLLMGGDYHEGCQYVAPLMAALALVKTPLGTYAVLGNNDYEACYSEVVNEMKRRGIRLLEHKVDTLKRGRDRILVAGVRNPFDLKQNGQSPTLALSPDDFVILLTHTPDYAEDVPVTHADLILAGHTHGGQVTLFGYAPVVPSRYGQRFLTGLKYNSAHIPMIVTNGIGTSQHAIRLFAPAEVVMITLHRLR